MVIKIGDIKKEPLMQDPYVKEVYELACDKSLFYKSPEELKKKRRDLFRKSLEYFSRHNEDYYKPLLENLDIQPSTAELEDLVDIAVPSDQFRGDGQKKYMIKNVPKGGPIYRSSGTTGKEPVTIYRSPLDVTIGVAGSSNQVDYTLGHNIEGGELLLLAAPEMRGFMAFIDLVAGCFESRGANIIYGMKVEDIQGAKTFWEKLRPNKENFVRFYKSKVEPKYIMSAPVGIYRMLKSFEEGSLFKKLYFKYALHIPPLNLGEGGFIGTGGGIKGADIPSLEELQKMAKTKIIAKSKGKDIPAPWMDTLGFSESITTLMGKPNTNVKLPHPLTEVFLLNKETWKPLKENKTEGVLGVYNPFCTSYLEAFHPGDIMRAKPDDSYYGKSFEYIRRLSLEEGWSLQRACGGAFEEGMKEKF